MLPSIPPISLGFLNAVFTSCLLLYAFPLESLTFKVAFPISRRFLSTSLEILFLEDLGLTAMLLVPSFLEGVGIYL